jgi:hypothetical protein
MGGKGKRRKMSGAFHFVWRFPAGAGFQRFKPLKIGHREMVICHLYDDQ